MTNREIVARYRFDPRYWELIGGEEVLVYSDGTVEVRNGSLPSPRQGAR